MTITNILFSSAGRRVELISCFRRAAGKLGMGVRLIAADARPEWSPACATADKCLQVPSCLDVDFIPSILKICRKEQISCIIPTIDTELPVYAASCREFATEGIKIIVADNEVIKVARDKLLTTNFLRSLGIPVPFTWTVHECIETPEIIPWPVIVKPRDGSCSKGVFIAAGIESLHSLFNPDSYIVQERCLGTEYTVNAFFDGYGHCVCCVPHRREFVRDGEVCFAETQRLNEYRDIADVIASAWPGYYGPICFQGFRSELGEIKIFEINARFGGGYPICDEAGGAFARWILQRICNLQPDYNDSWCNGLRMLRYDAAVFLNRSHYAAGA